MTKKLEAHNIATKFVSQPLTKMVAQWCYSPPPNFIISERHFILYFVYSSIYLFIYFCVAFLWSCHWNVLSLCLNARHKMSLYILYVCVCSCVWWMQRLDFTAIDCDILCKIPSVFSVFHFKRFTFFTGLPTILLLCVCFNLFSSNHTHEMHFRTNERHKKHVFVVLQFFFTLVCLAHCMFRVH